MTFWDLIGLLLLCFGPVAIAERILVAREAGEGILIAVCGPIFVGSVAAAVLLFT
jgi:hypothetical protein